MSKTEKPLERRAGHSLLVVRCIAVSKFFKSACLLVIGALILHTLKKDTTAYQALSDFVNALKIDEHSKWMHAILEKSLGISEEKLRWIYSGTLIYAGLYLIEGIGLFMDKGWAEWMTIITTAGFIPLELWEICHGPTVVRVVIFLLNVMILVYLILRLHWRHLQKQELRKGLEG